MPVPDVYTDTTGLPEQLAEPFLRAMQTIDEYGIANRTRRDYEKAWEKFEAYCAERELDALGADPHTVAAALVEVSRPIFAGEQLVGTELSAGTATTMRAAISWAHRRANVADPTDNEFVRDVLQGITRANGGRRKTKAAPLRPDDIRRGLECAPIDDTAGRHRLAYAACRKGASPAWLMAVPADGVRLHADRVVIRNGDESVELLGNDDPLSDPVRIARRWLQVRPERDWAFRTGAPAGDVELMRGAWRAAAKRIHAVDLCGQEPLELDDEHARLVMGAIGYRAVAWIRDRAEVLVGWRGGLRPGEIVASDDFHYTSCGDRGMVLYLPQSKTDQAGRGQYVALPLVEDQALCAVRALKDWMAYRPVGVEPMFCTQKGRRLTAPAVRKVVKRCCGDAFVGYSMRRGHATSAAEAGATLLQIAHSLRQTTPNSAGGYVDTAGPLATTTAVLASIGRAAS